MDKSVVSRSAFQRVVEENKKLLADLKIVTGELSLDRILIVKKWREKFKRDQELSDMIDEWGRNYMKENPNDEAVIFVKSLRNNELTTKDLQDIDRADDERKNTK